LNMEMAKIIFWVSIGTVVYTYVGYPILVDLASRIRRRAHTAPRGDSDGLPSLTVIIPAHNEERWIARKIENTLALDYPRDRMKILVASDGSTDKTVEIARQYAGQGVELAAFLKRAGKTAALNRAVALAQGEILVITDANALLEPSALQRMIPHFSDPSVGGVAGNRACVGTGSSSTEGEGLYWRYETWMKRSESRLYSCLGAYGQIFAVRRELFPYVPAVSDDFTIPMKILVSTSSRIVFEPGVIARIPAARTLRQEWERKIRSHVALLYDSAHLKAGLNPLKSRIWWEFWSHHLLRLAVPWAMLAALAASPWLWHAGAAYRALILCEILFYLAAGAGWTLTVLGRRKNVLYACFYFVFSNAAIIPAWLRWVARNDPYAWQRTERAVPTLPSTGKSET
jgi:biofilm PGA synthesis N-glycosyltransferase PgaC